MAFKIINYFNFCAINRFYNTVLDCFNKYVLFVFFIRFKLMLEKDIRWKQKKYTDWVATLPCANCGTEDSTVVAHHLKSKMLPHNIRGGGMSVKVDDWLTMPMCYTCHTKVHEGGMDSEQLVYIFSTLKEAFKQRRFTFK